MECVTSSVVDFTQGVLISSGIAYKTHPHEMCTPSVVDFTQGELISSGIAY